MKILKYIKTIKLLALFLISSIILVSCSSDDDGDDHDHEEELITTVIYTLVNEANVSDTVILTFTDLDGEGGLDGTYTTIGSISANTTYSGTIQLWNATENPPEDITEEVENEGDNHEFFYSSSITDITISKDDTDEDGNPIGIETTFTTGNIGTGTLTLILKHEPTKPNDGTSIDAGGSTDVEVSFSIEVE